MRTLSVFFLLFLCGGCIYLLSFSLVCPLRMACSPTEKKLTPTLLPICFCSHVFLCSASAYFDSSSASSAGVGGRRPTVRLPNSASGGMPRSVSNGASLQSVEGTIDEHDPEFFPSYHADLANEYAEINESTPSPPAYLIPGASADGDFNPYGQYDADDGECEAEASVHSECLCFPLLRMRSRPSLFIHQSRSLDHCRAPRASNQGART